MGEIAEAMLEGLLDSETGEYIDGESPGYPRSPAREARERAERRRAPPPEPKAHRCADCGKRFKTKRARQDHQRDAHAHRPSTTPGRPVPVRRVVVMRDGEIETVPFTDLADANAEIRRLTAMLDGMVPLHADGTHVFIDGAGDVELDHGGAMRAEIEVLLKERANLDSALTIANAERRAANSLIIDVQRESIALRKLAILLIAHTPTISKTGSDVTLACADGDEAATVFDAINTYIDIAAHPRPLTPQEEYLDPVCILRDAVEILDVLIDNAEAISCDRDEVARDLLKRVRQTLGIETKNA